MRVIRFITLLAAFSSLLGISAAFGAPHSVPTETASERSLSISTEPGTSTYFLQSVVGAKPIDASSFATSLASWKDTATGIRWTVVGAPSHGAGTAFVFRLDPDATQWIQVARLNPSDGLANDAFGTSVAIDGDTIAVGAPARKVGSHANSGRVYVYRIVYSTGAISLEGTVDGATADNAATGTSVALVGNTLLIGAPNAMAHGAVWGAIRSGSTWSYVQALTPSAASGGSFGQSLGWDGSRLVVGMPSDSSTGADYAGSAFVFQFDGAAWTEQQKLAPSDPVGYGHFGSSVAIFQSTIAVGARDHDETKGAVYSFKYIGLDRQWHQRSILTHTDSFQFGAAVSLSDGLLAVGATDSTTCCDKPSSRAYVFSGTVDSWESIDIQFHQGDSLGASVYISADVAIAGVPYDELFTSSANRSGWNPLPDQPAWSTDDGLFGDAVATSGDNVFIDHPNTANPEGSIYVFNQTAWNLWDEHTVLMRSNQYVNIDPGWCPNLSATDSLLAAGDPRGVIAGSNQGLVSTYTQLDATPPSRTGIFVDSSGVSGDAFGCAVAASGNRIAVGAPKKNGGNGAVFVYVNNGTSWQLDQTLSPPSGTSFGQFGASVAIEGDTLFVGMPYSSPATVFVFGRSSSGWTLAKQLPNPSGKSGEDFGIPLSVSGGTVAIGAPRAGNGIMYLYTGAGSSWNLQQEIDGGSGDVFFGRSAALDGNELAVGSGALHVSVYTRTKATWSTHATISSPHDFGDAIALSHGTLVIGAPQESGGRVYILKDDRIFADGIE